MGYFMFVHEIGAKIKVFYFSKSNFFIHALRRFQSSQRFVKVILSNNQGPVL
jgi:hypothetical protein